MSLKAEVCYLNLLKLFKFPKLCSYGLFQNFMEIQFYCNLSFDKPTFCCDCQFSLKCDLQVVSHVDVDQDFLRQKMKSALQILNCVYPTKTLFLNTFSTCV